MDIVAVSAPTRLMDMRDGYPSAVNVLGFSDPSVHFVDGRWTMFIGGLYLPALKTNIFTFVLPRGALLSSNDWQLDHAGGKRRIARPIVSQPRRGSWNRFMHSVSYCEAEQGVNRSSTFTMQGGPPNV
jgi:hypothetical protein